MRSLVNGPPVRVSMDPPFERRNMAPLANPPPLSKEETWPGPLTRGGGAVVMQHPPPFPIALDTRVTVDRR